MHKHRIVALPPLDGQRASHVALIRCGSTNGNADADKDATN